MTTQPSDTKRGKKREALIGRLHARRLEAGYSIRQLAKVIGLSFSSLARLERGTGDPDAHSRERIEKWLASGEGSVPRVRTPAEESWFAKMERRLEELEKDVAELHGRSYTHGKVFYK